MSYSRTAKYVGIIIAGLAAIFGLVGDHHIDGKITTIGKLLIVFAVLGVIIAVVGDRISIRESHRKELVETEWSRILDEPIISIGLERFIIGELRLAELRKLADYQEVTFAFCEAAGILRDFKRIGAIYNIKEPNSDSKDPISIDAKFTVEECKTLTILAKEPCKLYKLREEDGWIEAYSSSEFSWTKMSDYSCGQSGLIPWERFSFPSISKVKDLTRLGFNFKTLESFQLDPRKIKPIEDRKPRLILNVSINTPSFRFVINPTSIGYITTIRKEEKKESRYLESSISGHKLLTHFRNQFKKASGIHSDEIMKDKNVTSRSIIGEVIEVEIIRRLMKL